MYELLLIGVAIDVTSVFWLLRQTLHSQAIGRPLKFAASLCLVAWLAVVAASLAHESATAGLLRLSASNRRSAGPELARLSRQRGSFVSGGHIPASKFPTPTQFGCVNCSIPRNPRRASPGAPLAGHAAKWRRGVQEEFPRTRVSMAWRRRPLAHLDDSDAGLAAVPIEFSELNGDDRSGSRMLTC